MSYQLAYVPHDEVELLVLRSQLEEEEIRYVVLGDSFDLFYPNFAYDPIEKRYVYVWDEDYSKAQPILHNFVGHGRE